MTTIDQLFQRLRAEGRRALMPFVTAGDPDLGLTGELIRLFDRQGCHLCELGMPYSDPIADGPVIQASYTRALDSGVKLADIWRSVAEVTPAVSMPLVSMVSYAIVYRFGLERYVARARETGLAGLIVPDLPVDEARPLAEVCRRHDCNLIQLVTPTTPPERALRIAQSSTGFLYYVSVTGITGERTALPPEVVDSVGRLREQTELPICVGFGISQPEHVRMLAPVADGVIVGSAFVRRLADCDRRSRADVLADIGNLAAELLAALPCSAPATEARPRQS